MKNLKERIKAGEAVHGCWISLGSPVAAEIVGKAGFDWVLIDLEHGSGNEAMMLTQLQVLAAMPVTPLVRTDEASRSKIQRILDYGATGIMFPQFRNEKEAGEAVSLMYYPPKGTRGIARVRANAYGANVEGYAASLAQNLLGIVQIETLGAVDRLEAIASLELVDVLFVGPSDLSLAMGIFRQFMHPDFQRVLKAVAQAAKRYGKAAGILLQDINEYKMYYDLGYRFIASGADTGFVMKGAMEMVEKMKQNIK